MIFRRYELPTTQQGENAHPGDHDSVIGPRAPESTAGPRSQTDGSKVWGVDRWLVRRVLRRLGNPPIRIELWNGEEIVAGKAPAEGRVRLHDRATLMRVLANPNLGFGDSFGDGRIEVEGDLVGLLEAVNRAERAAVSMPVRANLVQRWLNRPNGNALAKARDNIHHHYDLGNDFYRLWLDEQMAYTCAYFPDPELTLEAAQTAKMHHICRKLRLRPGQTVIEAGCGWGALARHMARHYRVTVRAYNISTQQLAYARERAHAEGLDTQVQFVTDDYRNIGGACDAFVSVGMLEHVGANHYGELGDVIHRCLKPSGVGLIHTIGRNQSSPTSPWVEKRIFPGAYLPTLGEIMDVFEPRGFQVLDVENLRLHYAKTLEHWLKRFDAASGAIEKRFDARFVRIWRLYLAASLAGFTTGGIQLFQVLFAPAENNSIPWTRADIYCGGAAHRPAKSEKQSGSTGDGRCLLPPPLLPAG